MYLSKLVLNPFNKQVRTDLNDCQQMHRTLLMAFPHTDTREARAEFGMLFRVESNPRTHDVSVLVQSKVLPNWSCMPSDYLKDVECHDISRHYTEEVFEKHRRLRFRLRANPTRKIDTKSSDGTKRNGKRVELYKEADQISWLKRKATDCGFRVCNLTVKSDTLNLNINPEGKITGKRWKNENRTDKLTFGSVLFEGELEVIDPTSFKKGLENGIGSGKAYGFGLLSIAPIR